MFSHCHQAGQAGGVASNTEAFYSYNYGNIHFVSLDSYGWETGNTRLYDTLGPQMVWLKQDLAANTQPWTVVYFIIRHIQKLLITAIPKLS
jgi:hypothetical protein